MTHSCTSKSTLPTFLDTFDRSSSPIPTLPSISLMPFSITYDGPSDVSTFLQPRSSAPTKLPDGTMEEHDEAAFRGRLIVSTRLPLPKGYQGLVFTTTKPRPPPLMDKKDDGIGPDRPAKKAKVSEGPKKPLMRGTRTSPRKKTVVVKYSLDSDEEENEPAGEEEDEQEEPSIAMMQDDEEVKAAVEAQDVAVQMIDMDKNDTKSTATSVPLTATSSSLTLPDTPKTLSTESSLDDVLLARDEIHLQPFALFSSIELWHPDTAVDKQSDVFARALAEWTGLAARIHAY